MLDAFLFLHNFVLYFSLSDVPMIRFVNYGTKTSTVYKHYIICIEQYTYFFLLKLVLFYVQLSLVYVMNNNYVGMKL